MDCPSCDQGGRLKTEPKAFTRGTVSIVVEQHFWWCPDCEIEYHQEQQLEHNAQAARAVWKDHFNESMPPGRRQDDRGRLHDDPE